MSTESAQNNSSFSPTYNINFLLRCYALKHETADVPYRDFLNFVNLFIKQDEDNKVLIHYLADTEKTLKKDLELLGTESRCVLKYGDKGILKIIYPPYFIEQIQKAYKRLDMDMETAFPSEENLKLNIPPQLIRLVNIKSDFIKLLEEKHNDEKPEIIRLIFPDIINSILITSDLLSRRLLDYAIYKIKVYLDKKRNASYIENKIFPIFRQKSMNIREMINNISVKTTSSISTIKEPTDFSFRFWAHFANLIIQEYKPKGELLPSETDWCQAAYLIGFYNVFYKGLQQKEKEKDAALRHFETRVKKAPYVFSLTDLYEFKDPNGYYLLRKYSKSFLNKTLENKTQIKEGDNLPEIMRFLTSTGKEYYVHRESIISFCARRILEASQELRKWYINRWIGLLQHHRKSEIMNDDNLFLQDLQEKVQINYPVLAVLLNYNILYLANELSKDKKARIILERVFSKNKTSLQPVDKILDLRRDDLLAEAKTYLPFWETVPIIRWIVILFKRLFMGRKKISAREAAKTNERLQAKYGMTVTNPGTPEQNMKPAPPLSTFPEKDYTSPPSGGFRDKPLVPKLRKEYQKALKILKEHFVGKNESIDSKLRFLADKWNPLYDPAAKNNLVEDVNSMIRDFLRSLRRGFRVKPPDIKRIEALAAELSKNKNLLEIKKKEYLRQYIEIYMIKLLGENRF